MVAYPILNAIYYLVFFVVVFGTYLNYSANNDIADCYSTASGGYCIPGNSGCINVTLRWHKLMCARTSLGWTSLDSCNFLLHIFKSWMWWENRDYLFICCCSSVILMDDYCYNIFVWCTWPGMLKLQSVQRTLLLSICYVHTLGCLWFIV